MDAFAFHDGNIYSLMENRHVDFRHGGYCSLQMHSSLLRRLSQENVLQGHQGCVNAVAWNSKGSLLVSGSDDTRINIWSYSSRKLLHSIDTGHSTNIFCTKFVPETSDELVASGAGDAEVRLFNLSRLSRTGSNDNAVAPLAQFHCHTKRVKKLAVEIGNPNMVWSASEDGTLRQHDIREGASCPSAGSTHQECRNVLLDLRSGAKRSLADPPKQNLAIKSCDISSSRPHLILVGGSDAFARLYDRRMLPPLTSCRKRMPPPQYVNYFCPMHLSDQGRSSLQLTHVTFSPSGEEVLISYSGEHVYLMNVNNADGSAMQYTSADASKLMSSVPILDELESKPPVLDVFEHRCHARNNVDAELKKCRELIKIAERSLEEGTNCYYGIEACNEVLDRHCQMIGEKLLHECLCTRAALLLKRKWKNDAHMAIRDCNNARRIDSSSFRELYYISEALSQLGKHKEALDFAIAAQCLAPSTNEVAEMVENLRKHLDAAEADKNSNSNGGVLKSDTQSGRLLSLNEILRRSDTLTDPSQDGPRSEVEDSDNDEFELGFETSISDDEARDTASNILYGSLNLKIRRRGDSDRDCENSQSGSPSSSSQSFRASYQPDKATDLRQRYVGHCNIGTDIKQASFLGQGGEYVASGSDDGRWFIWEKQTGRLIKVLVGDEAVVNCIQSHPIDCAIATSGIDDTIKIWTPTAPVPSIVTGATGPEASNVLDVMESNQRKLNRNREDILPSELLEQFECAQS